MIWVVYDGLLALRIVAELELILEMAGVGYMSDYSLDSIRSPLKTPVTKTMNPSESVHTFAMDYGDGQSKGSYETARDKRVGELKEMFKPV